MTEPTRLDPFKPQQPSIPGISPGAAQSASAEPTPSATQHEPGQASSLPRLSWIVLVAVGVFIFGGGLFFWALSSSPKASQPGLNTATIAPAAGAETPKIAENLPVAPGPVATTQELAKTWSAKRFLFRDPVTSATEAAMVVRLPRGEYWGFSMREPYGNCELEFVSDLDKLWTDYQYRADHPMVVNPCNRTVYDLLKYGGGASNDGLVRGEMVQGPGIRPPMAIEIRAEGKQLLAVRME